VTLAILPLAYFYEEVGTQALVSPRALVTASLLIAAGYFVPRWLVNSVWRWQKLRHTQDWY
jgi:hypothetical protein